MDSLVTALIAAATGLIGFWFQSQLKKGEDFDTWFRSYYLDNGFNVVVIYLYNFINNSQHIMHDPSKHKNAPPLDLEALLKVSSLCDFPVFFEIVANADRILRHRKDPDLRSNYCLLLQQITPLILAVQQDLVSDSPAHRRKLRGLKSRSSIKELHRKSTGIVNFFIKLREDELQGVAKHYDSLREIGIEMAGEIRRAKDEGKDPNQDVKVMELVAKSEKVIATNNEEMGRIAED